MSTLIQVSNPKWFDQFNNGINFSSNTGVFSNNFKGNQDEKIKLTARVKVIPSISLTNYWITTDSIEGQGLFADKTISIGDRVRLVFKDNLLLDFTCTVISVSDDVLYYTDRTGDSPDAGFAIGLDGEDKLYVISELKYLKYSFGLNQDTENFASPLDGQTQSFVVKNMSHSVPVAISGIPTSKNWNGGSFSCVYVGNTVAPYEASGAFTVAQDFDIVHEFNIQDYNENQIEDIVNFFKPDNYLGDETINYNVGFEFRVEESNPNTSKIGFWSSIGNVGWYNENFNGNPSRYTVSNLAIEKVSDSSIQNTISNKTACTVSFRVNSLDSIFDTSTSQKFIVKHKTLLGDEDYNQVDETYSNLFRTDTLLLSYGDTGISSSGGLFTLGECTNVSTDFKEISFQTNLSDAEIDDYQYLLEVSTGDYTDNFNDRVQIPIIADVYDSVLDIQGLVVVNRFVHSCSPNLDYVEALNGFTKINIHAEEKVITSSIFVLDKELEAKVNTAKFKVVAFNSVTLEQNIIDEIDVDLSNITLVDNVQRGTIEYKRGFQNDNQFNDVIYKYLDVSGTGDYVYYFQIGWKVPWQRWIELENISDDFYDATDSQTNGFNKFLPKYDDLANWNVKVILELDVDSFGTSTIYQIQSHDFDVYGYDENENGLDDYDAEIKTFTEFGQEIGGNMLQNGKTEIRGFFIPEVPPTFTVNVDFTQAEDEWLVFAHANKYDPPSTNSLAIGDWFNNQADADDEFSADGITFYTLSSDLFDTTATEITCVNNIYPYVGLISPFTFESYKINGKMYSDTADDDAIGYVIAWHTDEFGVQNTLSLMATTGGCDFNKNPDYPSVGNDETEFIFDFKGSGEKIPPKWALVYNFGKTDMKILTDSLGDNVEVNMTDSEKGYNWNNALVGDLSFEVIRQSDVITANVSWTINGTTFDDPLTFNLTTDADTLKFRGAKSIGFATCSQNGGGFKEIVLVDANTDFYAEIRLDPVDSQSDKGLIYYSSLEDTATIGWDGTQFVTTTIVDSRNLIGLNYNLSAHIAPIDNLVI